MNVAGESDRHVESVVHQIDDAIDGQHFESDLRVTPQVQRKQLRQMRRAENGRRGDAQQTGRRLRPDSRLGLRLIQPREQIPCAIEKPLPRLRQMQAARRALQKSGAQVGLEIGHEA